MKKKKTELVTKLSLKEGKEITPPKKPKKKALKKKKVKKAKKKITRPVGRPTKMTQEVQDEICDRLSFGETLISICLSEHIPIYTNVMKFLNNEKNKDFRHKYAHARQEQADFYADEIVLIADTPQSIIEDSASVQRAKLRVDARKWHASKTAPKKYGDKVFKEITGKDGTAFIPDKYAKMTDEDLLKSLEKKKCKLTGKK